MENNKLIVIIGVVLIFIAVALSGVSAYLSYSALNILNGTVEVEEGIADDTKVPISQLTYYEYEDPLTQIYLSAEGDKTLSLSLGIGIALDSENDASEDELATITDKEGLIKDRISKLLTDKTFEYMSQDGVEEILQEEILTILIEELASESIVEVYFPDGFVTSVR